MNSADTIPYKKEDTLPNVSVELPLFNQDATFPYIPGEESDSIKFQVKEADTESDVTQNSDISTRKLNLGICFTGNRDEPLKFQDYVHSLSCTILIAQNGHK